MVHATERPKELRGWPLGNDKIKTTVQKSHGTFQKSHELRQGRAAGGTCFPGIEKRNREVKGTVDPIITKHKQMRIFGRNESAGKAPLRHDPNQAALLPVQYCQYNIASTIWFDGLKKSSLNLSALRCILRGPGS